MDLTRHQLREVAFQASFSMLYSDELEILEAIENVLDVYEEQEEQEIPQYVELVVTGVKEHQEELDKVSLNEALEIAKTFSDDESRRFINGVLSSAMNELDSSN